MPVLIHDRARSYHPVGRVEDNGILYASLRGYKAIGRFDRDGLVHDTATGWHPIGRVQSDGIVHASPYSYCPVGHVEKGGLVHDRPFGNHAIGRVDAEDPHVLEYSELAGAAFLLLLRRHRVPVSAAV